MTTINLKDFTLGTPMMNTSKFPDEVAAELKADKLYEAAHQRRTTRNKAQCSLDCDDGIEYSACLALSRRRRSFWIVWSCSSTCGMPQLSARGAASG